MCINVHYFCVFYGPKKNGLIATSNSMAFFNHYVLLDLTVARNAFTAKQLDFLLAGDTNQ